MITGLGGPLDYLDPAAAGLVGFDLARVRDDDDPRHFTRDQRWARPRAAEAAALLRRGRANIAEARERAAALQRRIHDELGEQAVTRRLLAALGAA